MSSCSGLHCAGCGGGAAVPVALLVILEGGAWVAAHVIEVAVASAACAALSVAAVVWLMRWQDRRQAAFAARRTLFITRADAAPLPAPARRELPPVINYFYVAAPAAPARVTRQAVTNTQLPPGGQGQGTR